MPYNTRYKLYRIQFEAYVYKYITAVEKTRVQAL